MTALSPDELALLRLMAEVSVPLRVGFLTSLPFFPGRQLIAVPSETTDLLRHLCLARMVELQENPFGSTWIMQYALTDKGRAAAGSGE